MAKASRLATAYSSLYKASAYRENYTYPKLEQNKIDNPREKEVEKDYNETRERLRKENHRAFLRTDFDGKANLKPETLEEHLLAGTLPNGKYEGIDMGKKVGPAFGKFAKPHVVPAARKPYVAKPEEVSLSDIDKKAVEVSFMPVERMIDKLTKGGKVTEVDLGAPEAAKPGAPPSIHKILVSIQSELSKLDLVELTKRADGAARKKLGL